MAKNDEIPEESPSNLVFILAIAGRIDAQGRILAKKLDLNRSVYYGYAVLDSLSSSYSMFKYFFDVFLAPPSNNNNDLMHEIMLTPGGIAGITLESLFLVGFSLLSCHFDDAEEGTLKRNISESWPYFRDMIKALKNAYKGSRGTLQAVARLEGSNFNALINPVGITLGVLTIANRLWLRYMVEERKKMMKINAELLVTIKKLDLLNKGEREFYLSQLMKQSLAVRIGAYVGMGIGGFIDGLYLYIGVLGLATLTAPAFLAVFILSAFYTTACIISRLYEEFDFQQRLFITQTKCELALITKEMQTSYQDFLLLISKPLNQIDGEQFEELQFELIRLITDFDAQRSLLSQQSNRTFFTAILFGLKNGLYAYGALLSVMFLLSTLMLMSSAVFPPALLITCVAMGIVLMLGFIIHSLVNHHFHVKKQEGDDVDTRPYDLMIGLKNKLENKSENDVEILEPREFNSSIRDGLTVNPSPKFFFQEWFEVVRSFFSGIGKGQKFVDFAGNALQEQDEQGHYHDSPIMYVLSFFNSLFFALVLALRALARGLGRAPLGQQSDLNDIPLKELNPYETGEELGENIIQPANNDAFSDVEEKAGDDTNPDTPSGLFSPSPSGQAPKLDPQKNSWRSSSSQSVARPQSATSFFFHPPSRSPSPELKHSASTAVFFERANC